MIKPQLAVFIQWFLLGKEIKNVIPHKQAFDSVLIVFDSVFSFNRSFLSINTKIIIQSCFFFARK